MQEEIKFREVYFHMAEGQLEICVNNDSLHSRKRAADRVVYDVGMGMNSILRQLSVVPFDIGIEALKLKTETAILLFATHFSKTRRTNRKIK